MKKYYFLILSLFVFCSCSKYLELEGPEHEPKQVLNTVFFADSLWHVELSGSISIMEESPVTFVPIENATVEIYEDGQLVETLQHTEKGIYHSNTHRPTAGKHYRIVSKAPGFPDVEAQDQMPENITYTFKEHINTSDLAFDAFTKAARFVIEQSDETAYYYGFSRFLHGEEQHQQYKYHSLHLWEDNKYRAPGTSSVPVFYGKDSFELTVGFVPEAVDTEYYLAKVSEQYYLYVTIYDGNYRENIFSEPTVAHSNVKNGYGIFAACNLQRLIVNP
jgi:hypothetical protein